MLMDALKALVGIGDAHHSAIPEFWKEGIENRNHRYVIAIPLRRRGFENDVPFICVMDLSDLFDDAFTPDVLIAVPVAQVREKLGLVEKLIPG